jgi:hypothetical protein
MGVGFYVGWKRLSPATIASLSFAANKQRWRIDYLGVVPGSARHQGRNTGKGKNPSPGRSEARFPVTWPLQESP